MTLDRCDLCNNHVNKNITATLEDGSKKQIKLCDKHFRISMQEIPEVKEALNKQKIKKG